MINTIIFDLAEVLITGILGVEKELAVLLDLDESEVLEGLNTESLDLFFRDKISEEDYIKDVIERNSWDLDVKKVKDMIRRNFQEVEGTRDIILALKSKGFRLALLSIHSKEWVDYCENKFDFHKLFDEISYSYQNGLCKPEKESFYHILDRMNVKANETIFIDDSYKNIEVAKEIGMNIILFENSKKLLEDLKKLSINV